MPCASNAVCQQCLLETYRIMCGVWGKERGSEGRAGEHIKDDPGQFKNTLQGFPGGLGVKNPPANAGDISSIPSLGRFHMPWSN